MELHKAIKEIVTSKGADMITNAQIINYLLDYQAFKDKPATKLILRDVINAGYGESILALQNDKGWQNKLKQYQHEFIDSCGYKEDLAVYVFESLAYAIGLNVDGGQEPEINSGFNVDSFFDIPEVETQQPVITPQTTHKQNVNPADLYTIAQSFFNEGKYQQARSFVEKAIYSQPSSSVPSDYLKLLGDILMRIGYYEEAIKSYNECFAQKSKELRCTIDQLREWFKEHKVRDYENVVFNYFFCHYALKRMNDINWCHIVKREAIYGIIDAVRYCADNGINPIEDHYNIYFTDRDELKNADILYEDGSFSHEKSNRKKAIANIRFCQTSDFEKSQGWNHGYIIPIEPIRDLKMNKFFIPNKDIYSRQDIHGFMWSKKTLDLPFPHSHYTVDDLNHWGEISKVESEHFIKINNFDEFPAFDAVRKFPQIPISGTSPWFLPSIHTCKKNHIFSLFYTLWTSSQASETEAILWVAGGSFTCAPKQERYLVMPVAAF